MSSSTPSSPHLNSHSTRPRASSDITSIPPHLLHRPRTGRIQRVHSNTTRVTSIRKQEAIWEAATGLSWTRDDESHPSPESALPDSIPPLALSLPDFFTETPQSQDFPSPKALPDLGDSTSLLEPTSTAPDLEESREALWYSLKQPPYSPKAETRGTSMEFMMPPQYSQFGSYSSSYTPSDYQYSGANQERVMAHSSPQPSSYAASYATSPAIVGSSPALSPRHSSIEAEPSHHYTSAARSSYTAGSSSTHAGYSYASTHPTASAPTQYGPSYSTSNHPYTGSSSYGASYGSSSHGYAVPSQESSYASHYAPGAYNASTGASMEDPAGVRVVNTRPKPQCWDHGCNGREFSTFSNLLRHQREKSGAAHKSTCPRCGAVFTRTTARNGHMAHDKCKRRSTASTSEAE